MPIEQAREAASRSSPGNGDLANPASWTIDTWNACGKESLVLEKVQVLPRLLDRIVNRTSRASARRAGKRSPSLKVDSKVKLAQPGIKGCMNNLPRIVQAESMGKERVRVLPENVQSNLRTARDSPTANGEVP